ncbi:MAG: phosphohydrolase [Syntrophobacter sp.]
MKCPGQDSRTWGPEAIFEAECPQCGGAIEFFKDEGSRKCRKCGHRVLNPKMDFGCAAYCRFASECLGADMPPELAAKRADLLKDRIAAEVKKSLGRDFKLIGLLVKVIDYAGRIIRAEKSDPAAVLIAARLVVLLPGSTPDGARNPTVGSDPKVEAPGGTIPGKGGARNPDADSDPLALAASILDRTGAPGELAREVLAILREVQMGRPDSVGSQYVFDARGLAGLDELSVKNPELVEDVSGILESFHTEPGRELARQILTRPSSAP